jgi:hypothetical protein
MNELIDGAMAVGSDRAALTQQVEALIARINPAVSQERRRDERFAIPVLFKLSPLEIGGRASGPDSIVVIGKNVSRRGFSFFHEQPLPHRRAILELVQPGLGEFAAEIDVTWCRFTKPGWYESGGRLVRPLRVITWEAPADGLRVEMSHLAKLFQASQTSSVGLL